MTRAKWQFRLISTNFCHYIGLSQLQYLWIIGEKSHWMQRCEWFRFSVIELLARRLWIKHDVWENRVTV